MMKSFRPPHLKNSGFLARTVTHFRSLTPGDKTIALALASFLCLSLFAGFYELERQFLVQVPSKGGGLIEGSLGAPRFINPLLALSDADRDLTVLTYAGLMGYGPDGALVPVLAESFTITPDGKTYTFTVRDGAKFSDGTPVTASDVVFTVEKAQDPALKSPEFANWANIRAEMVDARTVRFTLPKAYTPFLEDATLGILPSHLWRDISDEQFPFSPLQQEPVGAGPFRVNHVERDKNGAVKQYELRAFDGYALGRPYLSSLTFVFFKTEDELENAVERGRVESAYGVANDSALRAPFSRIFGVFLNATADPAFSRLAVRKALSVAVDREKLVREVLGGYGTPVWGPVPPGSGVNVARPEVPEDSIGAASAILAADGWSYDEELRTWTNAEEKLELSFTLKTSNVPELRAIAEAVRSDWEKLGVSVSVEYYDPSDLAASVIRPRTYEALLFGMVVGRDRDLFAFWDSSQRADPGLNIALYASRAVDTLLESLRVAQDPAVVEQDLAEVDALISADYPAVFTHAPDFVYAVPEDLRGVTLLRVAAPSDRFATAASWYRRTEWVWPAFASGSTR